MVFQQFNLVGRLMLFTNVALGALGRVPAWRGLLGAWPAPVRAEAMAALVRVGVADYAGQRASTLSGGQQQRGRHRPLPWCSRRGWCWPTSRWRRSTRCPRAG